MKNRLRLLKADLPWFLLVCLILYNLVDYEISHGWPFKSIKIISLIAFSIVALLCVRNFILENRLPFFRNVKFDFTKFILVCVIFFGVLYELFFNPDSSPVKFSDGVVLVVSGSLFIYYILKTIRRGPKRFSFWS